MRRIVLTEERWLELCDLASGWHGPQAEFPHGLLEALQHAEDVPDDEAFRQVIRVAGRKGGKLSQQASRMVYELVRPLIGPYLAHQGWPSLSMADRQTRLLLEKLREIGMRL